METNVNLLKFLKAKISQRCFEEYQEQINKGLEADDSLFNGADFNGDGKVDSDDKNMYEEYINYCSTMLSEDNENGFITIEDIAQSYNSDTDGNGTVSNLEKSYLEFIQSEIEEYSKSMTSEDNTDSEQNGLDIDELAGYIFQKNVGEETETDKAQDENTDMTEKINNLNTLKEECLEIQANMLASQEKYEKAKEKAKSAQKRQENLEERVANAQLRLSQAQQSYNEVLRKKMAENGKIKKNKNSNNMQDSYEKQLKEAKKSLNSASLNLSKVQGDYGSASANTAYYNSIVTSSKADFTKYTELYNTKISEFDSLYSGLTPEEQLQYGQNPFITDNSEQE